MKRLILLTCAAMAVFADFAQGPLRVTIFVKDNAKSGLPVPVESLTDGFTTALKNSSLQVINPFDDFGHGINSTRQSVAIQDESPIDIAKRKKAHGVVIVSVDSLESLRVRGPSSVDKWQYEVCMVFRLVDTWGEGTICSSDPVRETLVYNPNGQKGTEHLRKLLHSVGMKCAKELLKDPKLREWKPTQPTPTKPPKYPYEPLVCGDVENAINVLRGKMLEDSDFNDRYRELFVKRGGSPVLMVGGIKDLTKGKSPCAKLEEYIDHANDRLQTTLGMTHRFAIKDFAAVEELKPYIKNTDKDPLSDQSLLEALKRHVQPDLFVAGHIKYIPESGLGKYYIHLGVHDFLKGVVIWGNDVEVVKTLPKGDVR